MKQDIVICDTETTGLLEAMANHVEFQPQIIEIFCLKVDSKLKPIDEFYSLVKPTVPVPAFITKITGLSDLHLVKAPSFKQIVKPLNKFFKGVETFIAHNATFDYNMILNDAKRYDKQISLPPKLFCTVEQAFYMYGYRIKNAELLEDLTGEKEIKNQHRAKADVLATFESYKKIMKEIKKQCC